MLIANPHSPAALALVALIATSCAPASASKPVPMSVPQADAVSSTENVSAQADAGELEMDGGNGVSVDAGDFAAFVLTKEEQAYVDEHVPVWELGLPSRTYFAVAQTPPRGYRGLARARGRRYPGVRFSTVRAFAYNRMGFNDFEYLLAPDGTLGPTVVWPGTTLNEEQVERLIALARQESFPKMYVGCFFPRHAFVFYDAHERPVAKLEVCFECLGVRAEPWTHDFDGILRGEKNEGFRALCRELNFPDCDRVSKFDEERAKIIDRALDEAAVRLKSELRDIASKRADSPILRERMSLCDYVVWSARKEWWRSSDGLECDNGTMLVPPNASRCAQWVREHRVDGAEATACFDAWRSDLCFREPSTREACSAFPEGVAGVRWWPPEQRDEAKRWINGQSK